MINYGSEAYTQVVSKNKLFFIRIDEIKNF